MTTKSVRQKYIQQGVDPNDATARTVVEGGPRAFQAARHVFDASRGAAVKQIQDGNLDLAAQSANKAFENAPEGSKAQVTVGDDKSFNVSIHMPNGDIKNEKLSPDELASTFSGKNGFFDHVVGQGIATAISRGKNQAAGGPTSAGQSIPPPPPRIVSWQRSPAPQPQQANQAPQIAGGSLELVLNLLISIKFSRQGAVSKESRQPNSERCRCHGWRSRLASVTWEQRYPASQIRVVGQARIAHISCHARRARRHNTVTLTLVHLNNRNGACNSIRMIRNSRRSGSPIRTVNVRSRRTLLKWRRTHELMVAKR